MRVGDLWSFENISFKPFMAKAGDLSKKHPGHLQAEWLSHIIIVNVGRSYSNEKIGSSNYWVMVAASTS